MKTSASLLSVRCVIVLMACCCLVPGVNADNRESSEQARQGERDAARVMLEWMLSVQAIREDWPAGLRENAARTVTRWTPATPASPSTVQDLLLERSALMGDRVSQQISIGLLKQGQDVDRSETYGKTASLDAPTVDRDLTWLGPHLDRIATAFLRGGSSCACHCDAACDDDLFCNGLEVCNGFVCGSSAPPDCDDGNACTTDTCDQGSDECVADSVPPPSPVAGLRLDRPDPQTADADLSWMAAADVSSYNIYTSETSNLSGLMCSGNTLINNASDGGTLPPAGDLFVYLVSAVDCFESGLGENSSGLQRPNEAPCP